MTFGSDDNLIIRIQQHCGDFTATTRCNAVAGWLVDQKPTQPRNHLVFIDIRCSGFSHQVTMQRRAWEKISSNDLLVDLYNTSPLRTWWVTDALAWTWVYIVTRDASVINALMTRPQRSSSLSARISILDDGWCWRRRLHQSIWTYKWSTHAAFARTGLKPNYLIVDHL